MKVHITRSGALVIEPETELEGFALRCWEDRYGYFSGEGLKRAYHNVLIQDGIVRDDEEGGE